MRTLFFLLFLALAAAYGQTLTSVAVLPSDRTDNTVLNNDELEVLTDVMRQAALKVLPPETFVLLKQDVVVKRLGGAEKYIKVCTESSCIVDLGKAAQVDYVSQASVGKLGNKLRLKIELYNVYTGGLVSSLIDVESENIKDLLAIVANRVPAEVFSKIPGISGSPKTEPPPSPPPLLFSIESFLETPQVAAPPPTQEEAPAVESKVQSSLFGLQLGLRAGLIDDTPTGMLLGVVRDIAITKWFYIQPGLMYIQKMSYGDALHDFYNPKFLELPLLLSLKLSFNAFFNGALRFNAGPYFGLCVDYDDSHVDSFDFGYHIGIGLDIGMFYIGAFVENSPNEIRETAGVQMGVNF